jgi:hypothetical protein
LAIIPKTVANFYVGVLRFRNLHFRNMRNKAKHVLGFLGETLCMFAPPGSFAMLKWVSLTAISVLLGFSRWRPDKTSIGEKRNLLQSPRFIRLRHYFMLDRSAQLELLLDLECRQDDLMLRLEELDRRVEKTLGECLALRTGESQASLRSEAA